MLHRVSKNDVCILSIRTIWVSGNAILLLEGILKRRYTSDEVGKKSGIWLEYFDNKENTLSEVK